MLIIHLALALLSLISSLCSLFVPSKTKLIFSYSLIFGTFVSGLGLVVLENVSIQQVCLKGILYTSSIILILIKSNKKMAKKKELLKVFLIKL